mgnify:CR=1 FL=1
MEGQNHRKNDRMQVALLKMKSMNDYSCKTLQIFLNIFILSDHSSKIIIIQQMYEALEI